MGAHEVGVGRPGRKAGRKKGLGRARARGCLDVYKGSGIYHFSNCLFDKGKNAAKNQKKIFKEKNAKHINKN